MNREQFEDMLADYLGDEMTPEQRQAFEQHLAESDADRAEADALAALMGQLEEIMPAPCSLPASGSASPAPPASVMRFGRILAYAAILLLGVGIGWGIRPMEQSEVELPPNNPDSLVTPKSTPRDDRWPGIERNAFAKNCLAFSTAFSRPISTTGRN